MCCLSSRFMTVSTLTFPITANMSGDVLECEASHEAEAGRRPVVRAKIDHSRSLFSGLLSPPGSARNSACFSGPLVDTGELEEAEATCGTSLLVGSQSPAEYVIYNSPQRQGDKLLLGASARESKV